MIMNKVFEKSIGWDVANWGRAIQFWLDSGVDFKNKSVLELGAGGANGGLSLLAGSLGASNILCTDYEEPREEAKRIHKELGLCDKVSYKSMSALDINCDEKFDIVLFKSMLGGIIREQNLDVGREILKQVDSVLKPGGIVCLAENLQGTKLHMLLRSVLGSARNDWRYFFLDEIRNMLESTGSFTIMHDRTFGFLGALGRNENQKRLLGKVDKLFWEKIVSQKNLYVYTGVLKKND
jgi:ubiquinone/menaquinone biosynthesis C-methylase UbiE